MKTKFLWPIRALFNPNAFLIIPAILFGNVSEAQITPPPFWEIKSVGANPFSINLKGIPALSIDTFGRVRIAFPGSWTNARLFIDGTAYAREIYVNNDSWPDYVFDSKYHLLPINELEQYIIRNKHLPNIPSAKTVMKEGISVGDTQRMLLEKLEELTLYIIQQQKEIDALKQARNTENNCK